MRQNLTLATMVIAVALFGGQLPSPLQNPTLQKQLRTLEQQGLSLRVIDNMTIEVTNTVSGGRKLKTLNEPDEASIRAWAASRGVPILEIDPSTLDTTRWSGWFRYWTTLPLSNGFGNPLVVGDLDSNGRPEVYGIYKSYTSDFESHIYEVDSSGSYSLRYNYVPRLGPSRFFTDIDKNLLSEIEFAYGPAEYLFEQAVIGVLPVIQKTRVLRDSTAGSIFTGVLFSDLDGNGVTDLVYSGSGQDTIYKVFVSEYDSITTRFLPVWSSVFDFPRGGVYGGYTGGDFDGDGKGEFQCCEIRGKVFVVESQGFHSYARTWSDSTPFVNLFYQTSGDIDRDGKPEFYVGATMSNGNWTTMYEADSNDHYSPCFIFHLLSGGSLDEPTYLTPDVDQDGKPELLILSGADLYIFKSDGNDSFYLWCYRRFTAKESIQFYDFNHDGKQDFILSRARVDSLGRGAHFADVYLADHLSEVKDVAVTHPDQLGLLQAYPNPFNPMTSIRFQIPHEGFVSLKVYNMLGQEVATLVNEARDAGIYTETFNAAHLASGVYIYKLMFGNLAASKKLVLVR
jgi:hypothetical protein